MRSAARQRYALPFRYLPFTIVVSFMLGILTTLAAFALRDEPRVASREAHEMTPPAVATPLPLMSAMPSPASAVLQEEDKVEPAPAGTLDPATAASIVNVLLERDLEIPVEGVEEDDLVDTFTDERGSRSHEALDIIAPRGAKVRAVEGGKIQKLFTSKAGGLTIYQFDPTETFAYYYAHLDRYANGLSEGRMVRKGDVIGYVGSTGNASPDAPHLHFAVFRLGPERQWWNGEPINPYPVLTAD